MKTMEAGLVEYWKKRSTYKLLNMEICEVKNIDENQKSGGKPTPIKLIDFSRYFFFVLGIGYTLSVLVFLLEKITSLILQI